MSRVCLHLVSLSISMFFVDKFRSSYRRDYFVIHWVPTLLVFLSFLAITFWSWQEAEERATRDRRDTLQTRLNEVNDTLTDRINAYEEVLRSAGVLFSHSGEITRQDWKEFAQLFDLSTRYPAIRSLAYIEVIPASELQSHENRVRAEGGVFENYSVFPKGVRDIFASQVYVESSQRSPNLKLIGFDAYSNPARRAAMDKAVETREATATGTVYRADDTDKKNPGLAIYFPIVNNETLPASIQNTKGFVQIFADHQALLSDLHGVEASGFGYQIVDDSSPESPAIYQTPDFASVSQSDKTISASSEVDIIDRKWTIMANTNELAGTPEIQNRPEDIAISGTLLGLFMATFVYILLQSRTRALRFKEEYEIQSAKDELLALASHQLRTPATGVKQYIGMLLEGYAGSLSPKQESLLQKANESNERQLTTINEMLSVARADTGRLPIEKRRQNINNLVKDVIDEQKRVIEQRRQKITLRRPKTPIYSAVDPQYFRMALENIINNASKYTPEKGAIDVRLKLAKQELIISVDDTGVGIPARHFPMLFKKFSRIPNELSDQVSGTGIGLYLAKYIVEAHGGRLTFNSDPGVGSSFKIHLPAREGTRE